MIDKPNDDLLSPVHGKVCSLQSGNIHSLDALQIGLASVELGAGRLKKEDSVDPGAGVLLHAKVADSVEKGDTLAGVRSQRRYNSAQPQSPGASQYKNTSGKSPQIACHCDVSVLVPVPFAKPKPWILLCPINPPPLTNTSRALVMPTHAGRLRHCERRFKPPLQRPRSVLAISFRHFGRVGCWLLSVPPRSTARCT